MKIQNAKVYTQDGVFREQDVYTNGDKVAACSTDSIVLDGTGCYLIPGLTDIHFHGCAGYDFCDGTMEALRAMAAYEASCGITTIVPATMTLPKERLLAILRTADGYAKDAAARPEAPLADFAGINLEGPFISAAKKGAQNAAYIQKPDAGLFRDLQQASGGRVKLLTIAPEVCGAMNCIEDLKDEVVLSVGHTEAGYEQAKAAFTAGVHHVTHLYNAMTGLSHRAPGVVGAAADDPKAEAELICDGLHVHPAVVRQTFKMFGRERIIFISDSMEAAGEPDGQYVLGAQQVFKKGNRAELADGTLAGSATNLMDCMRTAVRKMGIPLEWAVRCAAVNPARSVGIYDQYGSITPGKTANLVLLREEDLRPAQVILRGRCLESGEMS